MLPNKVNDPMDKGAFLQKRQRFFNSISDISCIHCAGKLIFRNNIRQHGCINILGLRKGNDLFSLCFILKVIISCINLISTFQANNNAIQKCLQNFNLAK